MLVELIVFVVVACFLAVTALGHVLLAAAIVQCLREDAGGGRPRTVAGRQMTPSCHRPEPLPAQSPATSTLAPNRAGAGLLSN